MTTSNSINVKAYRLAWRIALIFEIVLLKA